MFSNSNKSTLSPNERLSKAADYGDLEGVKKAIEDGASLQYNIYGNIYNPPNENRNPLLLAIKGGHDEVAKYLLDKVDTIDAGQQHSIGNQSFKAAKTDEMKLLIAEKADIRLFTIQGSACESLPHTLKAVLKQIQVKNDIIKQLNEDLIQQKAAIAELQLKFDSLANDKSLSIEVNEHEHQLQKLKQEIASLKIKLNKGRFKDKAQNITTIQALSRGFLSRKRHSLTSLKECRKAEIQAKLPEAMTKFAAEGKYDDMAKLVDAMKHEKLHQAMQIIRGKPEQELAVETRKIKY